MSVHGVPSRRQLHWLVLLPLVLAGCVGTGGSYRTPAMAVPSQWQALGAGTAAGSPAPSLAVAQARDTAQLAAWWRQFHDPVLEALIADALDHNLDLRTAQAQLHEARAVRRLAGAELAPTVSASASASQGKGSTATGSGTTREVYRAGLDASWEIDLFGRLRSGRAAAEASLGSAEEQLRDVRVTIIAEVALNYIELRTAERRLALAESTLAARQESLDLAGWRQQAGLVSELDVAQARTELESTRAGLPALRTAVSAPRHRLAVLLGQAPGALAERLAGGGPAPRATTAIATGIPADTLRQRPDVRAAERRLAAQVARLDEAKAARYPALRLSGSLGWEALRASGLGDGGALARSLLASLSAPIFDAGRIRAGIGVQDARLEQSRLAYEGAVLAALEDVENALVGLAGAQEREQQLAQATASARSTHDIARFRYQAGLADFLSVLDSQRTLLSLEDQLAQAGGALALAQVRLYKALGGGWTGEGNASPAPSGAAAASVSKVVDSSASETAAANTTSAAAAAAETMASAAGTTVENVVVVRPAYDPATAVVPASVPESR